MATHETAAVAPLPQQEMREREIKKEKKIINSEKGHLHYALVTGEMPGPGKVLDKAKFAEIRREVQSGGVPAFQGLINASIVDRVERWKGKGDDAAMQEWLDDTNNRFLAQFRDNVEQKAILAKLGISIENGGQGLYDQYLRNKGAGAMAHYIDKVNECLSSDEISRHTELLNDLGGIFGKDAVAKGSRYAVEATNNLMVKDEQQYSAYVDQAADKFGKGMDGEVHGVLSGIRERDEKYKSGDYSKYESSSDIKHTPEQANNPQNRPESGGFDHQKLLNEIEKLPIDELTSRIAQLKEEVKSKPVVKDMGPFLDYVIEGRNKLSEDQFRMTALSTILLNKEALAVPDEKTQLEAVLQLYNFFYQGKDMAPVPFRDFYGNGVERLKEVLKKQNIEPTDIRVGEKINPATMTVFEEKDATGTPGDVYRVISPGFTKNGILIKQGIVTTRKKEDEQIQQTESSRADAGRYPVSQAEVDVRDKQKISAELDKAKQEAVTDAEFDQIIRDKGELKGLLYVKSPGELDFAYRYFGIKDEAWIQEKIEGWKDKFDKAISWGVEPRFLLVVVKEEGGSLKIEPNIDIENWPADMKDEERQRIKKELFKGNTPRFQ